VTRAAGAAFFYCGTARGGVGANVFYRYGEMGLAKTLDEWGVVAGGPDG